MLDWLSYGREWEFSLPEIIALSVIGILLIVLGIVAYRYRKMSKSPLGSGDSGVLAPEDFDRMQQAGLLTEEEVKKIRQRMASRFLEEESQRSQTPSSVDSILLEAERLRQERAQADAADKKKNNENI